MQRIGVDTGGTFTDLVALDDQGRIAATHKLPSTPDDPGRAVTQGVQHLLATHPRHATPDVTHGSTVATNALLEAATAPPVFVTTAGFEDTLHLARQHRPDLYALVPRRPDPPVPRERCIGVRERLTADGRALTPLTDDEITRVIERVTTLNPPAVAVSLLHSYAHPAHEQRLAAALRAALPGVPVTVSHELRPAFREYERAATCVINAAVAPTMTAYLTRLDAALSPHPLRVMASHGGTLSVPAVCAQPVRTILSGPAGGALAAAHWTTPEHPGVVTLDMGGTSTDVAVATAQGVGTTHEGEAAGLPVAMPMIDLHTVGAGGGSIAWVDPGGALRVGPRSAGATPGPACYGRGGTQPTVTDAHVALGHLGPSPTLAGDQPLDEAAAHHALQHLGKRLNLSAADAARGVLRVAEATMAQAVRRVTLQRGHDPRRLTLLPFGGAGGLHACSLADALGIRRVLVPPHPGLLSALGMLHAPAMWTREQPHGGTLDEHSLHAGAADLRDALLADVHAEWPDAEPRLHAELDLRYAGQSFELTVPHADDAAQAAEAFSAEHARLYGHRHHRPIQLVARRLIATVPPRVAPHTGGAASAAPRTLDAPSPCIPRDELPRGVAFRGPLVVIEFSATTLVPAGWSVCRTTSDALLLEPAP